MAIIKIKNFGPIEKNLQSADGLFVVKFLPVTVFIGHQASGKSTIAKLYSIFKWIEKKVASGDFSVDMINNEFFRTCCYRQDVSEYFSVYTKILYEGDICNFEYENNKLKVTMVNSAISKEYILPKIQYVSAARNLLTILDRVPNQSIADKKGNVVDTLSNIPFMVRDLNAEYIKALSSLDNTFFSLPIDETSVFYEDHNTFIRTKNKKISIGAASSGIQSITPLLLVSKFLSNEVNKNLFTKLQSVSSGLKKRIEEKILETKNEKLLEQFNLYYIGGKDFIKNDDMLQKLLNFVNKYIPACFVNVVEEPEQNLFPETQADILYELLKYKNENKFNQLIISTHSPYILTALNNAILANDIYIRRNKYIDEIPKDKMISFENISVYKLEKGNIIPVKDTESRLIDASQIDDCSIKIDKIFNDLMELN